MRPFPPAPAALILLSLLAGPGAAQPAARQPDRTPAPAPAKAPGDLGVRLQASPTRIDPLGLSFFLPEGSVAETTSFGANATVGVELPDNLGVMVIKGQRSTNAELTVEKIVDSMIEQLQEARGVHDRETGRFQTKARLDARETIKLAGLEGERFYMSFPPGEQGPALIRGVSVFRTEPGRFIVFDLMAEASVADRAKRTYETVVGTMDVTDRDALAARRGAAVQRMQGVLRSLNPSELRALAESHGERWERLYTPARSGDDMDATEHGYRRVRVSRGFRGEVSGRPERSWGPEEKTPGLIVRLDAMALETGLRIDTRAVYFVSEDLESEAWTVRMALRQGDVTTDSSVTGARSGTQMTIQTSQNTLPPTVTRPVIQGEGYVPQAITHLLAPVLARRAQAGEHAGYAYNPATNTVSLRWDTVEEVPDKPGLWVVRSRPDDNTPATSHLFNAKGALLRSELHNGRIWEPIELDRLVALWRRKGLPLE